MHPLANEFMQLFAGWTKNYGIYRLTGEISTTGKAIGKALSLKGNVTPELWSKHLLGDQGLGIIPITDKSQVKFAAIDIDVYDLNLKELNRRLREIKLPLTLCRTKSGGAHLYLFLSEWAPAKLVQQKVREMAAKIGYGSVEVFPKQSVILVERGDVGQWINMPYFRADGTERYALGEEDVPITASQFLKLAALRTISPEQLSLVSFDTVAEDLPHGPPCLNHLVKAKFAMGMRNNGLFNLGVYAKKAHPDTWESALGEMNQKFMAPPLSEPELQGVIKSLRKDRSYLYTCKQPPCVSHCNMTLCRAKKHGIGLTGVGMPVIGTLTKINTSPPIWFVDVEGGGRVELETTDLQYIRDYQTRCISTLNVMPPLMKQDLWITVVQALLEEVTVVEVPVEATPRGQLHQLLEEFCTSRVQGKTHDELLLGKPWTNNKRHYFRLKDFMAFLGRQKFTEYKVNRVAVYLRDWGADKHFFNVKGRGVNVYSVPEFNNKQVERFDIPDESEGKTF